MQTAALVIVKAFFNADNADMEIFLEPDLFILHQRNAQTAGRNIQQHHALFAGNAVVAQGLAYRHIFRINFHGHFRYGHVQTGPQFNLIKHEHLVAGFPHRCSRLCGIDIHAVILHQLPEALQDLTDLFHHGKGNAFIFKRFLT